MTTDLDALVASLRARGMPSVRNILVTVFGDAIRPYEAAVSVQSLTRLLDPLGVSERLVRTSLTRLADDDLVVARRVGNRSYYGVGESAQPLFDRAEARIYHPPDAEWDGCWTMAIIDGGVGTSDQRSELRRQFVALGLGPVAPNVMASPVAEPADVVAAVRAVGIASGVLVTRSENIVDDGLITNADLAQRVVPLGGLAERYRALIGWFSPFADGSDLSPAESFVARTLLIATYRRVVLTDPLLPAALLPDPWSGREAFDLVGQVYRSLQPASERWIVEVCDTPGGPLKSQKPRLRRDFGAL